MPLALLCCPFLSADAAASGEASGGGASLSAHSLPSLAHPFARWQVGQCDVECKTVERAAEQIMGEHDTDVAEVLFAVRAGPDGADVC